jgi:predicted esterase
MSTARLSLLLVLVAGCGAARLGAGIVCDPDSDCFYVPPAVAKAGGRVPCLLVLHCNGAVPKDLDTVKFIGDSLGWVVATCHATRNRRDSNLNDKDVVKTIHKLLTRYPVDSTRLFLFGFSGQGVQALAGLFLHPDLVRGVVATCPHAAAVPLARWSTLQDRCVFLWTRQKDWNRLDNERMHQLFNENGLRTELEMTAGEHGNGPATEMLTGCRWLEEQTGK